MERTGTQDDGTIFVPLKSLQKIFNRPDELTTIGIKLKKGADSVRLAAASEHNPMNLIGRDDRKTSVIERGML